MPMTRRDFVRGGVAAFTVSFGAPRFLSELAYAQQGRRNLVVLYLSGGNDALSMVVPYNDSFYYSRRPTIAVPAGQVLQIGTDSSNVALGLHPRLTGLKQIFDQGRLAFVQRTGIRTRAARIFSASTSGRLRIPSIRLRSVGSAAISIACRRRSIRSSAGTPPAACHTCCRHRTRLCRPSRVPLAMRFRARTAAPRRPLNATRR